MQQLRRGCTTVVTRPRRATSQTLLSESQQSRLRSSAWRGPLGGARQLAACARSTDERAAPVRGGRLLRAADGQPEMRSSRTVSTGVAGGGVSGRRRRERVAPRRRGLRPVPGYALGARRLEACSAEAAGVATPRRPDTEAARTGTKYETRNTKPKQHETKRARAVVPNEGTLVTQHDATITRPIVTSPYAVNRVA